MKNTLKWLSGIAALVVVLFITLFIFRAVEYSNMLSSGWQRSMHLPSFMGVSMVWVWGLTLGLIVVAAFGAVRFAYQPNGIVSQPAAPLETVCPHCDETIEEEAKECPTCGSDV